MLVESYRLTAEDLLLNDARTIAIDGAPAIALGLPSLPRHTDQSLNRAPIHRQHQLG